MGKIFNGIISHIQGKGRLRLLEQHRFAKYEQALDKLIKGEVPPEYVAERAKKFGELRHHV